MPRRLAVSLSTATTLAFAAACGSSAPTSTAPPTGSTAVFEMAMTIPAGQEAFKCQLVKLPKDAAFVVGGQHTYTTGSHHLLLFRTDLDAIPAGQEGIVDCYETGRNLMSRVRGVLYGAQEPTGTSTYPTGVGLPVKSEEVLLLQVHYLNAGVAPLTASVHVEVTLGKPDAITTHAGVLFFYDPFIHVPAGAMGKASLRCLLQSNMTLMGGVSHYHRRGVGYSAFLDAPDGGLSTTPFYTSSDWEHPRPMAAPAVVSGGTRLRFECSYDNRSGTREYFQGPSADDNEMCMFTALYYPALTLRDELCQVEGDYYGTGTTGCLDTLRCVSACPSGSAPTNLGTGQPDVHPCWQRCLADSCPNAGRAISRQLACTRASCASECQGQSAACTQCLGAHCSSELAACISATCQ